MLIFFAYLFSFIALFNALKLHDKFDPARYFVLLWSLQIIFIYAIFHKIFRFEGYGLVFISITVLLFSAGSLVGKVIGKNKNAGKNVLILHRKRALNILIVLIFISLFSVIYNVYKAGFNFKDLISFNILLKLNNTVAINRYSGQSQTNLISQFLLVFTYLTPLLGGYLLPLVEKKNKLLPYLALFPSMLGALTQAVKLGFISSVALWLIGMLISAFANNKSFIQIKFRTFLKIVFYIFLFLTVLFLSMIFRTGKFDTEIIKTISQKFINYAFGQLPAFDIWFSKNVGNFEISGGIKTFYGISNFIGLAERKQGVFHDAINYSINNVPLYRTNVYTVFRLLLEDFGFFGTLILNLLTGIISGAFYANIKINKHLIISQVIIISILFFISLSFATSVWAYTSYIVMIVFFYFILRIVFSKSTHY